MQCAREVVLSYSALVVRSRYLRHSHERTGLQMHAEVKRVARCLLGRLFFVMMFPLSRPSFVCPFCAVG